MYSQLERERDRHWQEADKYKRQICSCMGKLDIIKERDNREQSFIRLFRMSQLKDSAVEMMERQTLQWQLKKEEEKNEKN